MLTNWSQIFTFHFCSEQPFQSYYSVTFHRVSKAQWEASIQIVFIHYEKNSGLRRANCRNCQTFISALAPVSVLGCDLLRGEFVVPEY